MNELKLKQTVVDFAHESMVNSLDSEIGKISIDLNIDEECAANVAYLRTRNRHTQALEDQLIALHKAGTYVNMNEFGCTVETGQALLYAAMSAIADKHSSTSNVY